MFRAVSAWIWVAWLPPGAPLLSGANHPYQTPSENEQRSPCPALNTLANHGFLDRSGQGIPITEIAQYAELVFGLNETVVRGIAEFSIAQGIPSKPANDGTPTINLFDLYQHNVIEHDASMVRRDEYFEPVAQFNPDLFQRLVARSKNGLLTRQDLADWRVERIRDSKQTNPMVNFSLRDSLTFQIAEEVVFLGLLGGDPTLDTARTDFLESFLDPNRIPDGFISRQEQNLSILDRQHDGYNATLSFYLVAVGDVLSCDPPTADLSDTPTSAARKSWSLSLDFIAIVACILFLV